MRDVADGVGDRRRGDLAAVGSVGPAGRCCRARRWCGGFGCLGSARRLGGGQDLLGGRGPAPGRHLAIGRWHHVGARGGVGVARLEHGPRRRCRRGRNPRPLGQPPYLPGRGSLPGPGSASHIGWRGDMDRAGHVPGRQRQHHARGAADPWSAIDLGRRRHRDPLRRGRGHRLLNSAHLDLERPVHLDRRRPPGARMAHRPGSIGLTWSQDLLVAVDPARG